MPPIKVYANAPLHPDGVTPKTAEAAPDEQPAPIPTPTTSLPHTDPSQPPPPQPGARPQPGPAPTASLSTDPPAPQPGATPQPIITATHTTTTTSVLPPPSQLSIPPPTENYAPTRSTNAVPQPSPFEHGGVTSLPVTGGLHGRRASLEHPPGYVQNPYAADGTAADRARLGEAARQAHEEEGVIGSVKGWVQGAGETLGKLEGEAWKWAQGKK